VGSSLFDIAKKAGHKDRMIVEGAIYRKTHKDYKGKVGGKRAVLMLRNGMTTLVPLHSLSDLELSALAIKTGIWS
jgi:hypothetical protein